jgi:predicted RNA binding protein YcfA (HicA-like mRNA interferase family)
MKPLIAKHIVKILEAHGFAESRSKGSHIIYKHTATGAIVPVAFHGANETVPIGTCLAIIKQSGISKDAFLK